MKTLRYLLMVVMLSVVSVANSATAQNLAEHPEVQMHSTSGMVYSGSQLPQAAAEGTYVTGATIGTYTPAGGSVPHNIKKGLGGGGGSGGPGDRPEPYADPIGDAAWPLMLLACAFAIGKWLARTKPLR